MKISFQWMSWWYPCFRKHPIIYIYICICIDWKSRSSIFSKLRRHLSDANLETYLSRRPFSFSNSACSLSACCFKEASAPGGARHPLSWTHFRQHDARCQQWVSVDLILRLFNMSREFPRFFKIHQDVSRLFHEYPLVVIKHGKKNSPMNQAFSRKITDFYGPFSSKPCLMTPEGKSANLLPKAGPPDHLRLSAVARLVGRVGLGAPMICSDLFWSVESLMTVLG